MLILSVSFFFFFFFLLLSSFFVLFRISFTLSASPLNGVRRCLELATRCEAFRPQPETPPCTFWIDRLIMSNFNFFFPVFCFPVIYFLLFLLLRCLFLSKQSASPVTSTHVFCSLY